MLWQFNRFSHFIFKPDVVSKHVVTGQVVSEYGFRYLVLGDTRICIEIPSHRNIYNIIRTQNGILYKYTDTVCE